MAFPLWLVAWKSASGVFQSTLAQSYALVQARRALSGVEGAENAPYSIMRTGRGSGSATVTLGQSQGRARIQLPQTGGEPAPWPSFSSLFGGQSYVSF